MNEEKKLIDLFHSIKKKDGKYRWNELIYIAEVLDWDNHSQNTPFAVRFEKAFAGAITLAAILVLNVAIIMKSWEIITTHGLSNLANKEIGSHGASLAISTSSKLITAAQVTKIPTKE